MRYRGVHIRLLWRIILEYNVPTAFPPGLTLVSVFFVLEVKIHTKPSVPIAYHAIKPRSRYVPVALPSSTFLVNGDDYILPYRLHTYLGLNSNGSP